MYIYIIQLLNTNTYFMISKKYLIAVLCTFLYVGVASAQDEAAVPPQETATAPAEDEQMQSHTVMMGETIMLISKKYKLKPMDIYEYNPDATQGITANQVLQIPMHRCKKFKKKTNAAPADAPLYSTETGTAELKNN